MKALFTADSRTMGTFLSPGAAGRCLTTSTRHAQTRTFPAAQARPVLCCHRGTARSCSSRVSRPSRPGSAPLRPALPGASAGASCSCSSLGQGCYRAHSSRPAMPSPGCPLPTREPLEEAACCRPTRRSTRLPVLGQHGSPALSFGSSHSPRTLKQL